VSKPSVALVYTRQSVSQFDADGHAQGPSLDQQLDAVTRRPEFKGLTAEHFQDADRSGKETSKRPGYLALMARIRSAMPGEIAAVGFYDADRLHRNAAEFYAFMNECEERQLPVFEASGPIRNEDELSWGIKAVVASAERRKIARRVKDNLGYLRRQGRLLGNLPAGYVRGAGKGSVAIDEAVAPTVVKVFEMYASGGYSFRRLALALNAQEIKPIVRAGRGLTPAPLWSADVIKEILERPTYAGLLPTPRHAGDDWQVIAGTHPAIIPLDLWERCQGQRTRNRPGIGASIGHRTTHYPLTPILRCAECGSTMRGFQSQWRDKTTHRYYACSTRRRYGTCGAPMAHVEDVERQLLDFLAKCQPDSGMEPTVRELVKRGQRTAPSELTDRRAVKSLEGRRDRALKAWKLYGGSEAELQADLTAIDAELAHLKALPALPTVRQSSRRLTDLVAAWKDATAAERAKIAGSILASITVENRRITEFRPRPAWASYFDELAGVISERETRLELATSTLGRSRSTS
jgi:DNA invertase Pin-like site-specific DNA recombinase